MSSAERRRPEVGIRPRRYPPARFFVGTVLYAVVVVYLENASHISAGGVSGLSISLAHFLHIRVGFANLGIKLAIFGLTALLSGRHTAFWTMVSAGLSAVCMVVFQAYPLPFAWPVWAAFALIVTVGYLPIGLMLSKGYSTGGFSAIAQALRQRKGVPLWAGMTAMNAAAILAMSLAYGKVSGLLTLLATLWGGFSIQLWTRLTSRWLDGAKA